MASVQIENVFKSYDGQQILHGVSVDIKDGEFVVLVGPSGCGKSSLLRMIAGLEDISGGTIGIDNRVVNDLPPKERDISMVFQSYALYPHMTVAENMAFSMTLAGAGKAEKAKRVAETAELVGLTDYLDRHPRHLSGGQRQRVAMGRSIIRDPQVFLFDEPLSNLDAKLRVAMRAEIKALHKRLKTTIVYVTHDQVEAMTMADKIVVMNDGVIEQIGAPLELYDNPVNLFVAGFIGSPAMNFIEGTIKTEKSCQRFQSESGFDIPLPGQFDFPDQAKIVCGIRPEDFKVKSAGAGTQATIETTEPMGSETHILITTGSDNLVAVFHDRQVFNTDDIIYVQPNADHVRLFDPTTGQRIFPVPS